MTDKLSLTDSDIEYGLSWVVAARERNRPIVGINYYEKALLALKSARAENTKLRTLIKELREWLEDNSRAFGGATGDTYRDVGRWLDEHEPKVLE